MSQSALRFGVLAVLLLALGPFVLGQVSSTSSINGTVKDNSGAVIPGADITITNALTGASYKVLTDDTGNFTVPALPVGTYKLEAGVTGFKTAVIENIKVEVGVPANVYPVLTVGDITEQVTVQAGAEVIQTTSTNIATTITGRQIIELPFASRDALDLVMFLPGAITSGRPRTTSFQGLPKGSLNITTDGVNVQDNVLKSSDGFFTYIRPRIDSIEQVTVSNATPGAESASEGAVQIKFVTRAGSNDLDGSVYWYRRTTGLNSNFFFNNQPGRQQPRATNNLLQWGFRVGGPILKNKLFFFTNYEEFRLPEAATRTRNILSPSSERGVFLYPAGPAGGVDVLALAASQGFTSTIDATIGKFLGDVRSSTSKGTVSAITDPAFQSFTFTNSGGQTRRFPTLRLDWEVSERHHVENIYNYNDFASIMDFLNGVDPTYPTSPIFASQGSDRFSNVTAWRWAISPRLINEARFGLTGGTVVFFPEIGPPAFAPFKGSGLGLLGVSPQPTTFSGRRNAPVFQFIENLHWNRAAHSLSFGFNFSHIGNFNESNHSGIIPFTSFGVAANDPASALFTRDNFPGASSSQLGTAAALYATLTGLISQVSYAAGATRDKFDLKAPEIFHNRQREFGVYGQDSWKVNPNVTVNYGLRWEVQLPYEHLDGVFTKHPFEDLWGVSGRGNIFKPGTRTGRVPQISAVSEDDKPYSRDWNNFAPSLGFAWSPSFEGGPLKMILGEAGQSVFRGAYSMAFNREGMNNFASIWGSNPGAGTRSLTRSVGLGTLPAQTYFRAGLPPPTATSLPRTFPLTPGLSESVNAFDPDLTLGYVQSWSVGLQRELTTNTAFEVRYVGNRGVKLWRQYNLNEVNIFENGFLAEFVKAQQNLAINQANGKNTFQNLGLAGQSALPIFEASFGASTAFFSSIAARVAQGQAGSVASTLAFTAAFQNNRVAKGLADNLFIVNPTVFGGSFIMDNGGRTSYDGLQVELRRRMAKGLLVQGSYAYARALSNLWASSSVNFSSYDTLRNTGRNKGLSPWHLVHALKTNWIWELPFGPGARWQSDSGLINRFIGGWAMHGTMRLQSGRPHLFGSGRATVNGGDAGILLAGLDRKELQKLMKPSKQSAPGGALYFLPTDFINSTLQAMQLRPGTPTGSYLAPPTTPGVYGGRVFLYGPRFHRWDISAVKKTMITEGSNLELRVEFMNAFNSSNIMLGSPAADLSGIGLNSLAFGQTTQAYQDLSTTNDPGGRMIQLVARINF